MKKVAKADHSAPTYENQLWHARKLAVEQGLEALRNPHALIGEHCGCKDCFCCAAWQVYSEFKTPMNAGIIPMIIGATKDILAEKAVHSGDRFRQWFYPNLPEDYNVNPEVEQIAEHGAAAGKSAKQIAEEIYKANA